MDESDSIAYRCKRRRLSIFNRIHDPNQIMPLVVSYLDLPDLCKLQAVNTYTKLLTENMRDFTPFDRPACLFDDAPESSIIRLLPHMDNSWALGTDNTWETIENTRTTVSVIRRDLGEVCCKMIQAWSLSNMKVEVWSDALDQALMWGATSCSTLLSEKIPINHAVGQQKSDIMRAAVMAAIIGGRMTGVCLVEKYLKLLAEEGNAYVPSSHIWVELIRAPIEVVRTMLGFILKYRNNERIDIEVGLLFSGFVNRSVPKCLDLMRVFGAPPEILQWGLKQWTQLDKDNSMMALANMIEVS